MSVLSLGAIILVGGILAASTALLFTAVGAGIIMSTSRTNKDFDEQIYEVDFEKISDHIEQEKNLRLTIQKFFEIVSSTNFNIELSNDKDKMISKLNSIINNLQSSNPDYNLISNQINSVVKDYNNLLVENQILSTKKNEILYEIKKYKPDFAINYNLENISLEELEKVLDSIESNISLQVTDQKQMIIEKINSLLDKIKDVDLEYYNTIKGKYERLEDLDFSYLNLLLDQVKIDLSKIRMLSVRSQIFSFQLRSLVNILEKFRSFLENDTNFKITKDYPNLLKTIQEINDCLSSKFIEKEVFEDLQKKVFSLLNSVQKYIEYSKIKDSIKNNLKDILEKIGYEVIDSSIMEKLVNGEVIFIDLPYSQDYKVQVRLDENNQIYFRLVKFSDSTVVTEYERQKDMEIAKQWCQDYDKILSLLKENGIYIDNIKRIEPENMEITYILREEKKIKQEEKRYMEFGG